MPNILIISYTFPPNAGVGGRRWAKFSKYLHRGGHNIQVITNKYLGGKSNWEKDTIEYKNLISHTDFKYPIALTKNPKSILEKLNYKLSLIYVKIFSKGNYYDRSIFVRKNLVRKIENKINEGFDNILVTMAPFHLGTAIADLKTKYPKVNFIADFRDPWLNNETSYGFSSLTQKRKNYEIQSELKVISTFDKVISVSDFMTDTFVNRYKDENINKFITIENGFDKEDFTPLSTIGQKNNKIINFIFIGSFYPKAIKYLDLLNEQLIQLKKLDLEKYNQVSFDFYSELNINFTAIQTEHSNIQYHPLIHFNDAVVKLSEASVGLLFLTDDINYSFSTKFCEYLANNLPVIVFGKRGKTAEFIEKMNIGIGIDFSDNPNKLIQFINQIEQYQINLMNFDKSDFDIELLTKRIENLLI